MKLSSTRTLMAGLAAVALVMLGTAREAAALTTTYSDTWSITDSATIAGQTSAANTTSTGLDTSLSLSYFNLSGYKLTGVKVVYIYNTMTLSASLSAASSTTVSTASSSLSTTITSTDLGTDLGNTGIDTDTFTVGKTVIGTGSTTSNVVVSPVSSTDLSANRTQTTKTVLDSTDATVLTDFSQAGTFSLSAASTIGLSYTATGIVSLTTSGNDTGTVEVIYTYEAVEAVPEPSTWAMVLGGVGALGLFQRMRRRA